MAIDVRTKTEQIVSRIETPEYLEQLRESLPESVTLDRFKRVAITAVRSNPSLATADQASLFGSVVQAAWSFQLAARARGLGTCYTTLHLAYEREVAELLGIPYDDYCQVVLVTVGHTIGDDFKPAARKSLDEVVHRNGW